MSNVVKVLVTLEKEILISMRLCPGEIKDTGLRLGLDPDQGQHY